jgi:hypothetical protein
VSTHDIDSREDIGKMHDRSISDEGRRETGAVGSSQSGVAGGQGRSLFGADSPVVGFRSVWTVGRSELG